MYHSHWYHFVLKEMHFSFFLTAKIAIFRLLSAKIVKEVPNILISSGPHHPGWLLGDMVHTLASGWILKPPEHPIYVRSTVGQTSRKCVSFELQLHDSNTMIFGKNHFQHPNVLFYHGSNFSFGDSPPRHHLPSSPFWPKVAGENNDFFFSLCKNCEESTKIFNFQWAPPPWVGSRGHMVHILASGSI